MTQIVNINDEKPDFWITRSTIFGNPYEIGIDGTREEVIAKFKLWFDHLLKDKRFVNELEKLRDKKLGCFCKSKTEDIKCHGDIYVEYFNNNPKPENLKKKVAIIGSGFFSDKERMRNFFIKSKDKIEMIISGGARGADQISVEIATEFGIPYLVYPALWNNPETGEFDRGAGFKRNWQIIQNADIVVAYFDGKSSGTKNSIDIAKQLNKPLRIFSFTPH